jgi:signal transduction histidine kinase
MHFRVTSITTKLLLLYMFVGLASVTAVGIYSFYSARNAIVKRTMDQLISVRAVKKQQIEYFFTEKTRNLEFLSKSNDMKVFVAGTQGLAPLPNAGSREPETGSREPETVNRKVGAGVNEALNNIRFFIGCYGFPGIFLIRGSLDKPSVISLNDSNAALSAGEYSRFVQLWRSMQENDSMAVIDLFRRSATDTLPACFLGRGIRDASGRLAAAVILEVSSLDINRIMLQNNSRIGLGQSGEAYLVGHDLLMRSESRFIQGSVLKTKVNSLSAKRAISHGTGALVTPDYRNIKVFSAYEPINVQGLNWIILAEIDYAESLIPVDRIRNDIVLVSLIISLFILAIARLISIMITQPLIRLKNAALKAGQGDYSSRVDVRSTDEIGALAQTFNTMIDRIREERSRRLSAMFDGQEMERQRVSRELHDGLGQKLVGAKLQLENCEGEDFKCLQKTYVEIRNVFGSLIDETRQISNDLMPPALHELGLANALENLCITAGRQTGIEIGFYSHGFKGSPDDKTMVYLYRMGQEALNNAIRHSGAEVINMQLIENKENLILIIEDNGSGFEQNRGSAGGNGLYNMKERADILGGTFSIETGPGKGTTIRVKIPKQA